jgi:uncharacterized damage-inducible protein DinB
LCAAQKKADFSISRWAAKVDDKWFTRFSSCSAAGGGARLTAPKPALVIHFFNHQTHPKAKRMRSLPPPARRPDDTDLFLVVLSLIA